MDRGVRLDRTYQLNFGGNTDFLNMLERERLESKKISKTNAVTSMLDYELDSDDIHVGPSDHVPWLLDRKWCYIRMEGTTYGDVPLNAELKLEVWDTPNSAGVITDAIRCLKLGLDRGLKGTLVAPSSYFMKSPPIQIHDDIAFNRVEAFIRGEDNETLVGTEAPVKKLRKLASRAAAAARSERHAAQHRWRPTREPGSTVLGTARKAARPRRIRGTRTGSFRPVGQATIDGRIRAGMRLTAASRAGRRRLVNFMLQLSLPALAEEAALREPQLRARPRAAAGQPRGPAHGPGARYRRYARYVVELMRVAAPDRRTRRRHSSTARRDLPLEASGRPAARA